MDFGTSMVKYILCLFNTLLSIYGIVLVVFGALQLGNVGEYQNLQEVVQTHKIPIALIVLGSIVFLISMLPYDAIRKSYCMSITYAVMLLVLLIVQLVCVVYLWVEFWENFVNSMGNVIDKAWEKRSLEVDLMHAIEVVFKCCGKHSPTDYLISLSLPPSTCCKNNNCNRLLDFYITGCKSSFTKFWAENGDLFRFAGFVIFGIELVAFFFGCRLANTVRNYKRRPDYKIVLSPPA